MVSGFATSSTARRRRWVLGHYGETGVSLAEAREKRDEARKLLRQGIDPFEQKKEQQQAERRAQEAVKLAELEATRHSGLDGGVAGRGVL